MVSRLRFASASLQASPFRCYDKEMVLRPAALFLSLLVCVSALSQTPDQTSAPTNPNAPRSFHDEALNITYFYPGRFVPDPASVAQNTPTATSSSAAPKCAHSTFFANSVTPVDTSSFVLSTIDNTCPNVLRGATTLGPFIREQILRQLKQYGEPTVTQEATHYTVDGHPAAIVLASVPMPVDAGKIPRTTYAAKACVLGNVPVKSKKKNQPEDPTRHVLCFDFTTQHNDLYHLLFAFSMQFDNGTPQPLVPGSVIR
ncbi:hypothetical protein [Granulicella sp. S190]|uniref:hypothetical protein n=1 Tax=Granulicella sp. S190 TaxID=1747226 RepID=UPI00131B13B2|nr:hypothetical protein [Granulicella sp. S190]